jgi:hypothetical protein
MKNKYILLLIAVVAWLLVQCADNNPEIAGPSSEAGNPSASGLVVDSTGKPVPGAKVLIYLAPDESTYAASFYPQNLTIADSVTTDNNGNFEFNELATGNYTMEGHLYSSNAHALKKGINVDTASTRKDTLVLKRSGTITGIAVKSGSMGLIGEPYGFILVNVEGTYNRIVIAGDSGYFRLQNVPEGVYTLGFYSNNGFLTEFIDSVQVKAGDTTAMDTVMLRINPLLEPPMPAGLTADYDTASQTVTLGWNRVDVSDLLGYKVERRNRQGDVLFLSGIISDTVFVDSVASVPDSTTICYLARSVDSAFNESLNAGPVEITIIK